MQKTKTELQQRDPRRFRRHVLLQCLVAGLFVFAVFLTSDLLANGLVGASICASTFITFAYPQAESSRPRYLIGGYVTASVCGALAGLGLNAMGGAAAPPPVHALFCTLGVLATILLMICLDFQHPPAAAMAVAMVETSSPVIMGAYTIVSILVLCLMKRLLRRFLVNL